MIDRIAPRFRRYEPLAPCQCADAWDGFGPGPQELLDHRRAPGAATPDALQHLLARASWDADGVRDDLRDYVIDAFGDPGAILVVDLYRPGTMPRRRWVEMEHAVVAGLIGIRWC